MIERPGVRSSCSIARRPVIANVRFSQKQTSAHVHVMSALPPIADIGTYPCDVRFVPKADIKLVVKRGYSGAELTATDRPAHLSWKE
jgi:hypothetical protein